MISIVNEVTGIISCRKTSCLAEVDQTIQKIAILKVVEILRTTAVKRKQRLALG